MDIQWKVVFIAKLNYITLYDNPLKEPPIEVIKQGKAAIKDYFENKKIAETEVKLILMGNSRAGKTTLFEFMKNPTVFREEESTHGITVENFKWRDFNLNVWDFGGQDYYHATHRLFLTNNAVYILVWEQNTNKTEKKETTIFIGKEQKTEVIKLQNYDYYHWLTVIRKYDDLGRKNSSDKKMKEHKSPVIMLQNKIDDTETGNNKIEKLNKSEQEKYSIDENNLFAVSIKETHKNWGNTARYAESYVNEYKNFENRLQELIKQELKDRQVLEYDVAIRKAVRDRKENIISFSDYKNMCKKATKSVLKFPITNKQIRFATERLHTQGVLIYYGYISDSNLLKENVFIKPQYVTNIIYKILNKDVKNNDGEFTLNNVVEVFKTFHQSEEEAKYDAQLFIDLMKSPNFELIFEYKYKPNTYYATQYLPEELDKNGKFLFEQQIETFELAFVLEYQGFFSQSIISRIIAFYGFGANKHLKKRGLFWKNGLSFTLDGESFWVYCKFEEKKIYLKAQKNKKSETIYNIYNEILRISENDENISISLDDKKFDTILDIKKAKKQEYWFCFGKKYESVTISNNIAINGNGNIVLQDVTGKEIIINYNDTDKLNSVIEQFKQIQPSNNIQIIDLLEDIKKEILEIKEKIQPIDHIKELLYRSKKYNENLNKRLDQQDKKLDKIDEKLDYYYNNTISKLQNKGVEIKQLEDFIIKTNQQSTEEIIKTSIELTSLIAEAFAEYEEKFDDEMIKIYEFLNKPSDNWTTKVKLSVPLLNLIGINIEHEVKLNKYLKWIHNNL